MHAVFSFLDYKHHQLVKELWAELGKKFAINEFAVTPDPRITYQVAGHYNVKLLKAALRRFAGSKTSFQVRAGGVGIFPGPHPVLYIPVVRNTQLTQFHEALWQEISSAGSGFLDYYCPANWVPHITIGMHDMNKDNLSKIVPFLAERNINWEMTVDNITMSHNFIIPVFGKRTFLFALASENHCRRNRNEH